MITKHEDAGVLQQSTAYEAKDANKFPPLILPREWAGITGMEPK
jgi:hypothetical protein